MEYGLKYKPPENAEVLPSNPGQWIELRGFERRYGLEPFYSSLLIDNLITLRDYMYTKYGYDPNIDEQCCAAVEAVDAIFPEWRKEGKVSKFTESIFTGEYYAPNQDMLEEVDTILSRSSQPDNLDEKTLEEFQETLEFPDNLKNLVHALSGAKKKYGYSYINGSYYNMEKGKIVFDEQEKAYQVTKNIGRLAITVFGIFKNDLNFESYHGIEITDTDMESSITELEAYITDLQLEIDTGDLVVY